MRTTNSLKNISTSLLNNLLLNVLRFVSRTIFIKVLGETFLGINGMLSNVLGILAFADLGIGSAISYSLYKPLAENDTEKIKLYMNFYKKAYTIIGIVVLCLGLTLLPFLDFFVKDDLGINYLHIYYLIFLTNMVIGYLFSYKRTLIIADQKEYKIVPIIMIFNFLVTISQIIVLIIFENYFLYLIIQTLFILIENICVNIYIDKKYQYIKEKTTSKLSKNELAPIKKNVKALIFHKVGSYFVDSTDNIIISKFLGLSFVGLYSNYYLIINMINTFINSALNSVVSIIGNVNISETPAKRLEIFKIFNFISFIVFSTCSLCLFNLFNLFVGDIWIGEKFLLEENTVLILCLVFFVNGIMHSNEAVKSSAGLYDKDKFVPIFQSIINIVVSIILVKKIGLVGVFVGTLISALFVMIIKPIIIYKYIFEKKVWSYYIEFIKQILILLVSGFITRFILNYDFVQNPILEFIINGLISVIVLLTIIYLVYRNTEQFKNLVGRVKFLLNSRKEKNN